MLEHFKDVAHYILLDDANEDLENKEERLNYAIEQAIDNKIACHLYEKAGFTVKSSTDIFHWWLNK